MSLIYARYPERKPIERAIKLIMSRQLPVIICLTLIGQFTDTQIYCVARTDRGLRKLWKESSIRAAP